jgi:hypothetical protein
MVEVIAMQTTLGAVGLEQRSIGCRLGFHKWATAVNDQHEHCFVCLRCDRIDPNNDTHLAAYALAYGFGGRQALPHWWSTAA